MLLLTIRLSYRSPFYQACFLQSGTSLSLSVSLSLSLSLSLYYIYYVCVHVCACNMYIHVYMHALALYIFVHLCAYVFKMCMSVPESLPIHMNKSTCV